MVVRDIFRSKIEASIKSGVPHPYIVVRNDSDLVQLIHVGHLVQDVELQILPFSQPTPELQKFATGSIVWLAQKKDGCDIWSQSEYEMSETMRIKWNAAKKELAIA